MDNKHKFRTTYSDKNKLLMERYDRTIEFLKKNSPPPGKILDLGIENFLGNLMQENGYQVNNTAINQNLDDDYEIVTSEDFDIVTSFEVFEHLLAPYNLLKNIKAPTLIASVPLNLWFMNPHWNKDDVWDRHYHEFNTDQFDMLLDRTGWKIIDSEKWFAYGKNIGIRPILRRFYPRYYIVYCQRK